MMYDILATGYSGNEEQEEIWKDIPGYGGIYQASSFGRIRSFANSRIRRDMDVPHIMTQRPARHGYMACHIGKKQIKVHRLVAATFIENPLNKPQVNHKDGDKLNNRPENLEWVTNSENQIHANAHGLNESRKIAHRDAVCKPVIQYSKQMTKIATFESSQEAQRKTGIWQSQITNCCLKKPHCKSAGGYIWRFEGDD